MVEKDTTVDPDKVEKITDIFIAHFINLSVSGKSNFLECLIGFTYAYNKLFQALERLEILTPEQISTIKSEVESAVTCADDMDEKIETLLKEFKENVDG